MKFNTIALGLVLAHQAQSASNTHRHAHHLFERRHAHVSHPEASPREVVPIEKRGTCSLPNDPDLVYVPGAQNGGFAMSPDQPCNPGGWCPYACPPGKVMAQWQPGSSYVYPQSMNGGLQCGDDGVPRKPFTDKPYCVNGAGTISAVNNCGAQVTFCQTVLPGNEAMLIPTVVTSSSVLAVPDTTYWDRTAAHFYINPPGTGTEGCVWGTNAQPIGNWAPYVTGANMDDGGRTFVTLGWNPIFVFEGNGLEKTLPSFGVRIECDGCNGIPCEIDPSKGLNEVTSGTKSIGAGGAAFCVVTVPPGSKANIILYSLNGPPAPASTSQTPTPEPTTSTTQEPTSTTAVSSTSTTSSSSTSLLLPTVRPGIFQENSTSSGLVESSSSTSSSSKPLSSSGSSTSTSDEATPTESQPNGSSGRQQGSSAIAGLIVALIATVCFY